jgi:uncharacterized protein
MASPLVIDLRTLPGEGKHIAGSQPPSIFQLAADDPLRPASPVTYDLHAVRDGADLIVTGSVAATFNLECGRCLERFDLHVDLPDFHTAVPIEKETTIDLTEVLREDILLALPSFPRCEHGNVEPRECPARGKFEPAEETNADEPPVQDREIWKALDHLK